MSLLDDFTYLNRFVPKYPDDTDYNTNSPSYYEYLAKLNKVMKILIQKIYDYDKELAKRFEEWDKNLQEFPDDVKDLLVKWVNDGTLAQIINDEVLGNKADTADLLLLEEKLKLKADITELLEMNEKINNKVETTDFIKTNDKVNQIKTAISGISNKSDYVSSLEKGEEIRKNLLNKNQIRVATFNYKNGGGGRDPISNNIHLEAHMLMENLGVSIVGLQEQGLLTFKNIDMYKSRFLPFAHFFNSGYLKATPPRPYGNLTLSCYPYLTGDGGVINSSYDIEKRSYNRTVYYIMNKRISFYNTHLAHTANEHRAEQISDLYRVVSQDTSEYIIIVGDFNTRFADSFKIFIDNGFTHHNDNEFPTFKASGEGIDGVITSRGLNVVNKNIVITPNSVTDHNIFYVDIQL